MMWSYLPIIAIALIALVAYGWTHRDDGRTAPAFDCGRDDCRWRGRINHRHQPLAG